MYALAQRTAEDTYKHVGMDIGEIASSDNVVPKNLRGTALSDLYCSQ